MTNPDRLLPPAAALTLAATLLEAQGFTIVARNERGDSLYLARPDQDATLRLSNHARRPRQRRNHPEVVTSLVVATPKRPSQLRVMITAALRDFAACTYKAAARKLPAQK
ncbi:hypothetical protein [Methylobacterium sp. GC_Met_2]|uniref:hypothetical protein n=1 Tax=Methylobacterium sp. GC_Met_2 TaxID=2937376 RepID=UPI00226B7886